MKTDKKILLDWAATYGEDKYDVRASMYGEDLMIEFAKYYHTEQLNLFGVSRSLPTEEEMIIEQKKQCIYIDTFGVEKMDFAQVFGFEKCYNWLTQEPSDNG